MKYSDFDIDNIDFDQIKKEYDNSFSKTKSPITHSLNSIISSLSHNHQIPQQLKEEVVANLANSQQILNLIFTKPLTDPTTYNLNIFEILSNLVDLAMELNAYYFKSAYQILYLKANDQILASIKLLLDHIKHKNIKLYNFM